MGGVVVTGGGARTAPGTRPSGPCVRLSSHPAARVTRQDRAQEPTARGAGRGWQSHSPERGQRNLRTGILMTSCSLSSPKKVPVLGRHTGPRTDRQPSLHTRGLSPTAAPGSPLTRPPRTRLSRGRPLTGGGGFLSRGLQGDVVGPGLGWRETSRPHLATRLHLPRQVPSCPPQLPPMQSARGRDEAE